MENDAAGAVETIDALSKLEANAMVTEAGLAKMFRVSDRTIRNMIGRGELPPPIMLAGRSTWMAGRVLAHIESQMEKAAHGEVNRFQRRAG